MTLAQGFQTALNAIYPARCLSCGDIVDSDFGLCGSCWRDTAFVGGTVCDCCGQPMQGDDSFNEVICDGCLAAPRPWSRGRAALLYADTGRKLVLALKHGDRQEIAKPAALWMAQAARPLLQDEMVIAPIPLHWSRMLKRRYNQSALLSHALSAQLALPCVADLLQRTKRTLSLDGRKRAERHDIVRDAMRVNPKRLSGVQGKPVLLVDDVMTTGATLSAATQVLQRAGAGQVCVVTLARVTKDA